MHSDPSNESRVTRRDFLDKAAVGSLIGAGVMSFVGIIQLPLPKALNEPASKFKIGRPSDFPVNSFKTVPEKNVFVVRDDVGFRALSAVCTHLGCIVERTAWGFSCPCHGSLFDGVGEPVDGPAPKALEWLRVDFAPDGQLTVDLKKKVSRDRVLVV